jgi:DNA invertase Pin-like site-specific DNA recombinase
MATGRFVAYLRVSTQRQGASGLGLDAQRKAILDHLNGGSWQLAAEFVEVESGKRNDRPELVKALAACRLYGATLIIAKLDRLARNVAFVSNLMASGVEFVAVDFPQANRLTVHIMAAFAEHEREMISARTKAALAAAKARGKQLGNKATLVPGAGREQASAAAQAKAQVRGRELRGVVEALRAEGFTSAKGIARELSRRGIETPRGKAMWTATQVGRLLGQPIRPSR